MIEETQVPAFFFLFFSCSLARGMLRTSPRPHGRPYALQDDFGRCVYAPGQCRTTENCEDGLLCKDASQETPGKCVECLVSWRDCSDEKFCDPDGNCRMPGSIENNCPPYAPADSFGRCAFRPGECRTGNDCEEDGQLCKDGSYTSPGKCVDCIEDKDCRPQCEFGNIDPECLW